MRKVLLLMDVQNLWENCQLQFGKRSRINFKSILAKAKTRKHDNVTAIAYVVAAPDKKQENLIKKLSEAGFETALIDCSHSPTPEEIANSIVEDGQSQLPNYEALVLASSNLALLPLLELAQESKLIAFCVGLEKTLAQAADVVQLLSKSDTVNADGAKKKK